MVSEATNAARDLQNLPSNVATHVPGRRRGGDRERARYRARLLDRDAILARGIGAFAAVAQNTYAEARLIIAATRRLARRARLGYVGKAMTFDTGGILDQALGQDAGDEVRHVGGAR